jgi:AmiR/NasT family two-component response regulator
VRRFPAAVRLALEMAAHEERERRALEGELAELERAWKEAEEIAAIADDLLLPGSVADRLRRLRGG